MQNMWGAQVSTGVCVREGQRTFYHKDAINLQQANSKEIIYWVTLVP